MSTTTQIREWLHRCRSGDQSSRDELFSHLQSRLKAIVRSSMRGSFGSMRDDLDSDDGVQELQVRLLERWEGILSVSGTKTGQDEVKAFFGLAAQVIRDILIDGLRKKYGRGKQRRPDMLALDQLGGPADSSAVGVDPADQTHIPDRIAQWAEVHEFLGGLPEPLKQVAELRWYHDLSHAEVGEMLGCAEITARTHWAKVRHQLRERFSEIPFDWAA